MQLILSFSYGDRVLAKSAYVISMLQNQFERSRLALVRCGLPRIGYLLAPPRLEFNLTSQAEAPSNRCSAEVDACGNYDICGPQIGSSWALKVYDETSQSMLEHDSFPLSRKDCGPL